MGAWIETFRLGTDDDESSVAPYVGAWIETVAAAMNMAEYGRTLRGCVD